MAFLISQHIPFFECYRQTLSSDIPFHFWKYGNLDIFWNHVFTGWQNLRTAKKLPLLQKILLMDRLCNSSMNSPILPGQLNLFSNNIFNFVLYIYLLVDSKVTLYTLGWNFQIFKSWKILRTALWNLCQTIALFSNLFVR